MNDASISEARLTQLDALGATRTAGMRECWNVTLVLLIVIER